MGELRPVSLELIGAARALLGPQGAEGQHGAEVDTVTVAILANSPRRFTDSLKLAGVDEIVAVPVAGGGIRPPTRSKPRSAP